MHDIIDDKFLNLNEAEHVDWGGGAGPWRRPWIEASWRNS